MNYILFGDILFLWIEYTSFLPKAEGGIGLSVGELISEIAFFVPLVDDIILKGVVAVV